MALCAQQRRSCTMILCTRRLWARARACALALAASCAQQHRSCVMVYVPVGCGVRARAGVLVLAAVREGVRADADAAADGNVDEPPCTCLSQPDRVGRSHAGGGDESQASRQRVGGECRKRLMSILSCAMDSSAAPRAALAAATERPSDVSAAIVEWGTVPQTPTAITTSGSKAHVCGSRAPGTRRATEAHGLRRSHGSYLARFACAQQRHQGWRRQRR